MVRYSTKDLPNGVRHRSVVFFKPCIIYGLSKCKCCATGQLVPVSNLEGHGWIDIYKYQKSSITAVMNPIELIIAWLLGFLLN